MIKKLKITEKQSYEDLNCFEDYFPLNIKVPIKSELMDIKLCNSFKVEQLNKRFEIRITELEKNIIENLKAKNINVSELVRDFILSLDKAAVIESIKHDFFKNSERINALKARIKALEKDFDDTFQDVPREEVQDLINFRYKIKFEKKELESELYQREKFNKKYELYFPIEQKLFNDF